MQWSRAVCDAAPPPFTICSTDIEVRSPSGDFPQVGNVGDQIVQIGVVYQRSTESKPYKQIIYNLYECDMIISSTPTSVICCDTEMELIEKWAAGVVAEESDIVTGWNLYGFDVGYLWGRYMLQSDEPL